MAAGVAAGETNHRHIETTRLNTPPRAGLALVIRWCLGLLVGHLVDERDFPLADRSFVILILVGSRIFFYQTSRILSFT